MCRAQNPERAVNMAFGQGTSDLQKSPLPDLPTKGLDDFSNLSGGYCDD